MSQMNDTMVIDGQLINLSDMSLEKIETVLSTLSTRRTELRGKIGELLVGESVDITDQLKELQTQLIEINNQITTISAARFERVTSENIHEEVSHKKETIAALAKMYGQDPTLADSAIKGYEEALTQVQGEYRTGYTTAEMVHLKTLEDAVKQVTLIALKKQAGAIDLSEQGDTLGDILIADIENVSMENLRVTGEKVEIIERKLEDYPGEFGKTLKDITKDETALTTENKNNPFKRFWSNLTGKINGKEKFQKNAIEPLEKKSQGIKNVLPFIKNMIKEELIEELIKVCIFKKGEPIKSFVIDKVVALMPMIESGAVTLASILATSTAAQVLAVGGLVAGAAIIAKKIADKIKQSKAEQAKEGEVHEEIGEPEEVNVVEGQGPVIEEEPDELEH